MEEEKILENITKSIGDRLKVPIIVTYICVLILYNWDILFYLIFEDNSASEKIKFIQETYGCDYYKRILICLTISVVLIILFTILNTLLNFGLKWFYRKDKEIITEIESFEKMKSLTEKLSNSIDEIKKLNTQIENLEKINDSITSKKSKINISDISKKDYNKLIEFLNSKSDKEKLMYSLTELIESLKTNEKISLQNVYKNATYEHEMMLLIQSLYELKLVSATMYKDDNNPNRSFEGIKMGTSFREFLKMEI